MEAYVLAYEELADAICDDLYQGDVVGAATLIGRYLQAAEAAGGKFAAGKAVALMFDEARASSLGARWIAALCAAAAKRESAARAYGNEQLANSYGVNRCDIVDFALGDGFAPGAFDMDQEAAMLIAQYAD